MTDIPVLIYTLFGSRAEARQVGKTLIMEKHVACANHLAPALSQYEWEGRFCEEEEFPTLFKTTAVRLPFAMARLKDLHSYALPAILSWPAAETDPDYTKWLVAQTEN